MKLTRRAALAGVLPAAACTAVFLGGAKAEAHPSPTTTRPAHRDLVSVELERPGGSNLPEYWLHGTQYVAGQWGQRYNLRVTNRSSRRVEVVVTVDGRDVVSGKLGNYRKQRGYVIAPYDSITIEGYRQSMDHVAAFRFTDPGNSYSSRMGNARDVGVIGVAVFKEYRPKPRPRPRRPITRDYPHNRDPYHHGPGDYESDGRGHDRYDRYDRDGRYGGADEAAPTGGAANKHKSGRAESFPSASPSTESSAGYGGWSPPPERQRLGTEYGETTYSSVRETTFRRRNKRRPDRLHTIHYDSLDGLRARGVIVDHHHGHYDHDHHHHDPEPFPDRRYAQPPPRRY
jgi:hypothetical protein